MQNQFVSIRIAELRHPAHRRFHFLHVEFHAAFLQLRDRGIDIVHFERDRCSIARRLPGRMTTNADGGWPDIVLDPRAFHGRRGWFQLERFLIKFSRAFLVGYGDGDECDFFNH